MNLVLLGDPVAHSLSPVIHRAALAAAGLEGTYRVRRVDTAGLVAAIDEIRDGRLDGANVTMPYKAAAAAAADWLTPLAARAAAVNTLYRGDGGVVGDNTDVAGVETAWRWHALAEEGPVLVLGAGGAAAAALLALADRTLIVAARRRDAAAALAERLGVGAELGVWGDPAPGAVVVNATPVGMHGEALPPRLVEQAAGLFDMAYGGGPTPAVVTARRLGLPVAEGPDMLLAQAVAAFALWTGRQAPVEAMRRALRRALTG